MKEDEADLWLFVTAERFNTVSNPVLSIIVGLFLGLIINRFNPETKIVVHVILEIKKLNEQLENLT